MNAIDIIRQGLLAIAIIVFVIGIKFLPALVAIGRKRGALIAIINLVWSIGTIKRVNSVLETIEYHTSALNITISLTDLMIPIWIILLIWALSSKKNI